MIWGTRCTAGGCRPLSEAGMAFDTDLAAAAAARNAVRRVSADGILIAGCTCIPGVSCGGPAWDAYALIPRPGSTRYSALPGSGERPP